MVSYSYKPKVLDFLDQVCSLYESEYMLASLSNTGNFQSFIEKVCELAGAHGLPSKEYRVALSDFSMDKWKIQLDKVYDCLLLVALFKSIHSKAFGSEDYDNYCLKSIYIQVSVIISLI